MEPINVLVVDDSLVIRGMIVSILEKDPEITVVGVAASAADADAVLRSRIVDVVTLDIEMPGVSGFDYLPSLARRHIPTIMLSGRTIEGSEESDTALSHGATACFNKANAVRDANGLIRKIKEVAHSRAHIWAENAAAPAPAVEPTPQTAAPAAPRAIPLASAPTTAAETTAVPPALDSAARRLVAQHGAGAMRVLHERLGQMVLQGEVKHIAAWRAVAADIEQLTAEAATRAA